MIAKLILALLLLAMAVGQLASLGTFADSLRGYGLVGERPRLRRPRGGARRGRRPSCGRRAGGVLGLAVAAFWTVLAAQAFARGVVLDNCGCFGRYLAQELRWWVLIEDAEFLLLAAWVLLRLARHDRAVAQDTVGESAAGGAQKLEPAVDR